MNSVSKSRSEHKKAADYASALDRPAKRCVGLFPLAVAAYVVVMLGLMAAQS